MLGVLDPTTPYPYLLYTLAGAGVVAYALPKSVEGLEPAVRDIYNAHPPARALCALVYWALWPLFAVLLLIAAVVGVAMWVIDLFEDEDD